MNQKICPWCEGKRKIGGIFFRRTCPRCGGLGVVIEPKNDLGIVEIVGILLGVVAWLIPNIDWETKLCITFLLAGSIVAQKSEHVIAKIIMVLGIISGGLLCGGSAFLIFGQNNWITGIGLLIGLGLTTYVYGTLYENSL